MGRVAMLRGGESLGAVARLRMRIDAQSGEQQMTIDPRQVDGGQDESVCRST